uniref:Immunoglobulin subtype domain-containing protein n=1 Tax=Dicentrarchus labrax TaxID=13489 RepID=A0A8P4KQ01_DICLA
MPVALTLLSSVFLLASSVLISGSSAVTPVFVQKGNDVLLNLMFFRTFFLLCGTSINSIIFSTSKEPTVLPANTGRVELSENDYSLKVKNLQEADSGVYTANVTVQVSPVNLKVDSVSRSSDSCNLTVTCSTQDSHISSTFRCVTRTCSQEGGEQSEFTTSSLHVYLVNNSIICNHSNKVNWTKDIKMTEHLCPQHFCN